MKKLTRITLNPEVMGGKPCIRGIRVTVGTIVALMASGHPSDEILPLPGTSRYLRSPRLCCMAF